MTQENQKTLTATPVAQLPLDTTQVRVEHWNAPLYGGDNQSVAGQAFTMELIDQREASGKAMLTLAPEDADIDDQLAVAMEVTTLPGTNVACQALHFYPDGSDVALTFYKRGNELVIRAGGSRVQLVPTPLADGERGWVLRF